MGNSNTKNNIPKSKTDMIFLGLAAMLFSWMGMRYPGLFYTMMFLAAVPVVVITYRHKETAAVLVCLAVLGIQALIFRNLLVLAQFGFYAIVGTSIGYSIRSRFSLKQSVAVGGVALIIVFAVTHLVIYKSMGINLIQQEFINKPLEFLTANKNQFLEYFKAAGGAPEDMYASLWTRITLLFLLIPGFITGASLVGSYVILVLSLIFLNKKEKSILNIEPFAEFIVPKGAVLFFVLAQLMVEGQTVSAGETSGWLVVLLNFNLILGFLFMVQGIALVDHWFNKLGLKGILKALVYLPVMPFIIFLPIPFVIAGTLESLLNFRKLEAR